MIFPKTFRELKEDIKAWRRGEYRVSPGLRGRVYARKADTKRPLGTLLADAKPDIELVPTRVWKDSEQKWYDVDEYRKKFGGK